LGTLVFTGLTAALGVTLWPSFSRVSTSVATYTPVTASPNLVSDVGVALNVYADQSLQVVVGAQSVPMTMRQLGVSFDARASTVNVSKQAQVATADQVISHIRSGSAQAAPTLERSALQLALGEALSAHTIAPQDATLSVVDGKVSTIPEKLGQTYTLESVAQSVLQHAQHMGHGPIVLRPTQTTAAITVADLAMHQKQAEAILAEPLVLTAGEHTFTVEPREIGTWLTLSAATGWSLNQQLVASSLSALAQKVDVAPTPERVVAGTDAIVADGKAGFGIDREQAGQTISAALMQTPPARSAALALAKLVAPREETSSAAAPSSTTTKEIVVVLSEQRLYAWNNGHLDKSFLISSGLTFPTPVGTFAVYNKIKDHVMAGADYYLPHVPDSMYFTGSYALHGAYWHNNFGNPMSHGCVNEPLAEATWLFDWTPVGTTVRVVP
jgi:lipoprotein-anchoring transpeptidase ErfK/SrfK